MDNNITTLTDSYKEGHHLMMVENTTKSYAYFESRVGALFNETVLFGLQPILKKHLVGTVVTQDKINFGKSLIDKHLGPNFYNLDGWQYILDEHNGKLPVKIKAVPEGLPIPTNNVLMDIENTDPKCAWLVGPLETILTHVWAPSYVATFSREIKILLNHYLNETTDNKEGLDFMLHDFGFRSSSSIESAGACGAGHLIPFQGTDTIRAIEHTMFYYSSGVCGFSVLASEHSIATAEGPEGEAQITKQLIKTFPEGILSLVIDSYNDENFISKIARDLRLDILSRNGKTVFRPDSGDPVPTTLRVFELLEEVFGSSFNNKGYKILHPKIGVLWGDGIGYDGIRDILHALRSASWSTENIVFGMGSSLSQKFDRDIQRFAFKCSAQERNGNWYDMYKKPKDISKMSKRGIQYLYKRDTGYETTNQKDPNRENILKPVFENGKLLIDHTFEDIRKRAEIEL